MPGAPFYGDLAEAPPGATARWFEADDGVRLRAVWWSGGDRGTVVLFPGRTEFCEKYGRVAASLGARGFSVAVIDWRGQGLSDRLAANRNLGHVAAFGDYQRDVAAYEAALAGAALPRPWHLVSHSMGGAIALRRLHGDHPFANAVFSAPMWGLTIDPKIRPLVHAIAAGTTSVGFGEEFSPGTTAENYLRSAPFEDNSLTTCEDCWHYMQRLVAAHPGLEIGGPSINWLYEALAETRELMAMDAPGTPAMAFVGSDESVIDKRDVIAYMERWPAAATVILSGARHEILMEKPAMRDRCLDLAERFLAD